MDSHKQFEEWYFSAYPENESAPEYEFNIWQAGRASMLDEAVKSCLGKEKSTDCVLAIKDIQP